LGLSFARRWQRPLGGEGVSVSGNDTGNVPGAKVELLAGSLTIFALALTSSAYFFMLALGWILSIA
jgi:hypothetical protein